MEPKFVPLILFEVFLYDKIDSELRTHLKFVRVTLSYPVLYFIQSQKDLVFQRLLRSTLNSDLYTGSVQSTRQTVTPGGPPSPTLCSVRV